MIIAMALAIASISLDEITQINFSFFGRHTTYYCGWEELHSTDDAFFDQNPHNDQTYNTNCDDGYGHDSCHMEKIGNAWVVLICIALAFGLLAISGFLLDLCVSCDLFAMSGTIIFILCMLAAMIQWAIEERCSNACEEFSLVCHAEWGTSLILAPIAAGVGIASCLTYSYWESYYNHKETH